MTAPVLDRPSVRVLPAPAYDPPFEDEYGSSSWAPLPAQPLLDLPSTPARRRTAPATAAAPSPACPPALSAGHTAATRTGPPASLGARDAAGPSAPTRAAANRFLTTCLEILNGYRPVAHLRALSHPLAAAKVLDAMTRALRRAPVSGRDRRGRVDLSRMRICEPRPGVAEISAVLRTYGRAGATGAAASDRCWAVAFRLEQRHGRWQCHVAEIL